MEPQFILCQQFCHFTGTNFKRSLVIRANCPLVAAKICEFHHVVRVSKILTLPTLTQRARGLQIYTECGL